MLTAEAVDLSVLCYQDLLWSGFGSRWQNCKCLHSADMQSETHLGPESAALSAAPALVPEGPPGCAQS